MVADIFIDKQSLRHIALLERFHETEIIVVVEHIEVGDGVLISDIALR